MSVALSRPTPLTNDTTNGILLHALAVAAFAVMDALVKWYSGRYHVVQLVFFRSAFAFVPLFWLMWRGGSFGGLRIHRPALHLARGLFGLTAIVAFFLSYRYLALADVFILSFVGPLFMTALSVPLLGEKVGWRRWSAVGVGFLGVLVIVRPGGSLFTLAALLPILGAFSYAVVGATIKVLSRTDSTYSIVFYFTLMTTVVSGVLLPFVWVTPTALSDWLGLISIGLIGGIAQIALTTAFRRAPVSVLAPFEYFAILWGTALGYWVWNEIPGLNTLGGAALIVCGGLYILHRETLLHVPKVTPADGAAPCGE